MGISYGTSIVRDGLVLLLDAANRKSYPGTGSTWYDLSPSKINCSLDAIETSFVSDGIGSIYFNTGISPIAGPSTPNAFTTITAFKKIGTQTNNFHVICGGQTHEVSIQDSNSLRIGTYTTGRFILDTPLGALGRSLLDGEWHIIVSKYDGTNLYAYHDGDLINTKSVTGTTSDTYKLSRIGCWENDGYQANGYIPFIIMYNRALTDEEIMHNVNALKGRYGL